MYHPTGKSFLWFVFQCVFVRRLLIYSSSSWNLLSTVRTGTHELLFQQGVRHGRSVIEEYPRPSGQVDSRIKEDFAIKHSVASLVKYLVRHVSREIPPGLERGLPDNEPHHRILRQELEGFDLTKVPEGMRRLITLQTERYHTGTHVFLLVEPMCTFSHIPRFSVSDVFHFGVLKYSLFPVCSNSAFLSILLSCVTASSSFPKYKLFFLI